MAKTMFLQKCFLIHLLKCSDDRQQTVGLRGPGREYGSHQRVVHEPGSHEDESPPALLSQTLKYLFLLFSADSVLPLDEFVLTTEAHPLRVIKDWGLARAAPPPPA